MGFLAYVYLAFGFWHLLFGIQCFKKHFVSISSVTFWYLYSTHAFKGARSLPEAELVLTLRIQTRHSRSIWLHACAPASSVFDSSFTLLSIASSPYQVISRTNVHNSCKYTTMIHAQLFQRPFNNSKSIPSRWYCQCSLEYFHYKNPSSAGYSFVWGKNVHLTSTL